MIRNTINDSPSEKKKKNPGSLVLVRIALDSRNSKFWWWAPRSPQCLHLHRQGSNAQKTHIAPIYTKLFRREPRLSQSPRAVAPSPPAEKKKYPQTNDFWFKLMRNSMCRIAKPAFGWQQCRRSTIGHGRTPVTQLGGTACSHSFVEKKK